MKIGKITPNGVSLEKHENDTVVFFTNLGYNIELIPPSNTPKAKTPDFMMDNAPRYRPTKQKRLWRSCLDRQNGYAI